MRTRSEGGGNYAATTEQLKRRKWLRIRGRKGLGERKRMISFKTCIRRLFVMRGVKIIVNYTQSNMQIQKAWFQVPIESHHGYRLR